MKVFGRIEVAVCFQLLQQRPSGNFCAGSHTAVLAGFGRTKRLKPIGIFGISAMAEERPQRLGGCVQASVVSDFVEVYVFEEIAPCAVGESERPVFNLGITRKKQLAVADLKEKDDACVVHDAVEIADKFQCLIGMNPLR